MSQIRRVPTKLSSQKLSASPVPVQVSASRPRRAAEPDTRPLQVTTFRCEPLADIEPQALGLTYWFDAAGEGEPYPVSIRFTGRRIGAKGKPRPRDSFSVTETVENVVAGSGRLAVTARVVDIAPGEWQVTATPVNDRRTQAGATRSAPAQRPRLASGSASGATGYARVISVRAPGVYFGAWPALVGLGVAVGLATQALLATHAHLHATRVLTISLVASLVGLFGAKFYYLAGHYLGRHFLAGYDHRPAVLTAGLCIQGFVAGAVGTLVVGALVAGVPVGALLDVTAPGLFLGMTIGRFGCFFGGCCVGRPTASRWGLWSSDQRLGVRRIPTQLLESAVAFSIGLPALLAMWNTTPRPGGVVFIGTIAAYTLGRQLLFPLRDNSRKTAHGRTFTMALTGLVILVDIGVGVFV
ncbi:MAG: prolipoprotein diacylglyceryl transferase [Acidimicrobiales bacterium]